LERTSDGISYPQAARGVAASPAGPDKLGGSERSKSPRRNEQAIENERMERKLKVMRPQLDSLKLPY